MTKINLCKILFNLLLGSMQVFDNQAYREVCYTRNLGRILQLTVKQILKLIK